MVKQKFNRLWWFLTLLFKGSDISNLKSCDYLIVGHDHDKSLIFNSKHCSPILDFLEGNILSGRVEYLGKPGSKLKVNTFNIYKRTNVHYLLFRLVFLLKGSDYAESAFWRYILKRTSPKYVLGTQIPPFLCKEAMLKNIVTVNLQHGMIQSEFDYYKYTKSENEVPKIFYCWDSVSIKIARKKFKKQVFKEIGHPWHNQFLTGNFTSTFYSKELKYLENITKGKSLACISLQYDSEFDSNLIPKEVIDKLNHLRSLDYIFAVRFHPIALQIKGLKKLKDEFYTYNKLRIDNVSIIDATNLPLPLLLPFVDIHLTKNSAVFLESQIHGVKTYYWESDPYRLSELKDYESLSELLFPISDLNLNEKII